MNLQSIYYAKSMLMVINYLRNLNPGAQFLSVPVSTIAGLSQPFLK